MPKLLSFLDYWFDCAFGYLRPRPHWTVTWPTLPGGIYTIAVRRATGIDDAVRQARVAYAPTGTGYSISYDREPQVWQVKPGPARRVSGPNYEED